MRIYAGCLAGAAVGLLAGLEVGVILALSVVRLQAGHGLNGIQAMLGAVFYSALVGTVAGCATGGLIAARTGRPDPPTGGED